MLPGMAADERLFEPQRREFPGLIVPPWIEPEPYESLASTPGGWRHKSIRPGLS